MRKPNDSKSNKNEDFCYFGIKNFEINTSYVQWGKGKGEREEYLQRGMQVQENLIGIRPIGGRVRSLTDTSGGCPAHNCVK